MIDIRTGLGFDVHQFCEGDHVWLCGVKIPHTHGLKGHSDADAPMHAVCDALFGAVGAGDIGIHFPCDDERWRAEPSETFLKKAVDEVKKAGGIITNIDITIICQAPRIATHRDGMIKTLARITGIEASRINIKATTTEMLGFTGRSEGLAAQATATVLVENVLNA